MSFVGVSAGASLALLAAEHPALAARTRFVGGFAPYADLADMVRLGTTGFHREGRRLVRYPSRPFLGLVVARSLVAGLPFGAARARLLARLRRVDDDARDPLAVLRGLRGLDPEAAALVRLLTNRDPRRFDRLYAALPERIRAAVARLSPIRGAARLRAKVELASAPLDKYFPASESRSLVRAAPDARLTVTSTLAHAVPEPSFDDLAGLARLDAFVVRGLRAARG